jgi:hypothetical protein
VKPGSTATICYSALAVVKLRRAECSTGEAGSSPHTSAAGQGLADGADRHQAKHGRWLKRRCSRALACPAVYLHEARRGGPIAGSRTARQALVAVRNAVLGRLDGLSRPACVASTRLPPCATAIGPFQLCPLAPRGTPLFSALHLCMTLVGGEEVKGLDSGGCHQVQPNSGHISGPLYMANVHIAIFDAWRIGACGTWAG